MNIITSVPAVVMDLQPDPNSNQQSKATINETNSNRDSFVKCFETYLQEAKASETKNAEQSQVADILNWQFMLMTLPLRPKVRLAGREN